MSRRYDSKTTIFTPEGRLLQVEYAINNINNAGLCLGITTAGGILKSKMCRSYFGFRKRINFKIIRKGKIF